MSVLKNWLRLLSVLARQLRAHVRPSWTDNGELSARVRARQIETVIRQSPLMIGAGTVNAVMVLAVFWGTGQNLFLVLWAAIIPYMLNSGFKAWQLSRRGDPPSMVSTRGINRAIYNALFMGCCWGVMPMFLFPGASNSEQVLLTCLMAGTICGYGIALSAIPAATICATLPVALGSAFALFISDNILAWDASILLAIYTCVVLVSAITTGRQIVTQIYAQSEVEKQRETIHLLLKEFEENSSDWLWKTDGDGQFTQISQRMSDVFGCLPWSLYGTTLLELLAVPDDMDDSEARSSLDGLAANLANHKLFRDHVVVARIGGQKRWLSFTGQPIVDSNGKFIGYRGVGSDVTAEKRAEAQSAHLANHDSLTGLGNRLQFCNVLESALNSVETDGGSIGVFSLDLDQFKLINDTRGHPFGDAVLRSVANRLNLAVGEHDTVARLGGDEFAIVHCTSAGTGSIIDLAHKVVRAFQVPFDIEGSQILVDASVGICIAPKDGKDLDTLLKNADLALFKAKGMGRGQFCMFEPEMDEHLQMARKLELDVKPALANGEFYLEFQPLVCGQNYDICSLEALMRWHHPERGNVGPAEFIPVAERIGIISEIGEWALREACTTATHWPDHISVAVNLSTLQFHDGKIVDIVRECLADTGIAPERLELEITESLLIRNTEDVLCQLKALKNLGVTISMDDFGTGYSSLSYLWRFPFDKIKIDRSFVTALGKDSSVEEILRTIVALAKLLNVSVVAEGVETSDQACFLREIGSDQLQGFYFGRPMPLSDVSAKLIGDAARNQMVMQTANNDTEKLVASNFA